MSRRFLCLATALSLLAVACGPDQMSQQPNGSIAEAALVPTAERSIMELDSVLRHIVTFKFKGATPVGQITEITRRFGLLQDSIPGIIAYEHGINNSPEGLSKGLNHIYQVTFESAVARDNYLPHPAHQRFVALLGDVVEDVMVVDYWGH